MNSADPNFDRIARPYRFLEYVTLGRALERCRNHFLPHLHDRKQALVLGDGDGRFLARLLAQNSQLQAEAVDTSAAMLQLLRRNCEAAKLAPGARLVTHQANVLTFLPAKPYDLVVSHFVVDCLTQSEVEALISRIAPALSPQALWLISDFRIPSGPMGLFARLLVRSLYFAFRILAGLRITHLPDHAAPLSRAGLTRIYQRHSLAGILTTELWQAPAGK